MRVIRIIKCVDIEKSVAFYTNILDFEHVATWSSEDSPAYSIIKKNEIEIHLSTHSGDGVLGNVVYLVVEDVDSLFKHFLARGLDTAHKIDSPVHQGPVNQTWGWREFYVTDPSGNTMRFGKKL
jgi:catechol 2,3-dioxygenase-like lactoylglutathione lyase family enzyme